MSKEIDSVIAYQIYSLVSCCGSALKEYSAGAISYHRVFKYDSYVYDFIFLGSYLTGFTLNVDNDVIIYVVDSLNSD